MAKIVLRFSNTLSDAGDGRNRLGADYGNMQNTKTEKGTAFLYPIYKRGKIPHKNIWVIIHGLNLKSEITNIEKNGKRKKRKQKDL